MLTGPGLGAFMILQALAYDPLNGNLQAIDGNTGQLLRIDPTTGVATPVGATGFRPLTGLAIDPRTRTLCGSTL